MTPFTVHLMRHGAVEGEGRLIGSSDVPSTREGDARCVAQGKALAFARVVCSDLIRARRPAEALAAERSVPLRIDPDWRELAFGAWEGCAPADLPPDALARFWADPDATPPPGGERWSALVARVGRALARMEGDTLVIAHAGAMRAALASLFGFSATQCWTLDLPYGAVLSLRVWPGEPVGAQITGLAA